MGEEVTSIMREFSQTGFSIGVAAFLLLRLEKELRTLSGAIQELSTCHKLCKFKNETLADK